MGAPIFVELHGETDSLAIAMKELNAGVIPIVIRRYLPDKSFEDWYVTFHSVPVLFKLTLVLVHNLFITILLHFSGA